MSSASQGLKQSSPLASFLKFIINSVLSEPFPAPAEEPGGASAAFPSLVPCARIANAPLEDTRLSLLLSPRFFGRLCDGDENFNLPFYCRFRKPVCLALLEITKVTENAELKKLPKSWMVLSSVS